MENNPFAYAPPDMTSLKGLSHEIDFDNVDENGHM